METFTERAEAHSAVAEAREMLAWLDGGPIPAAVQEAFTTFGYHDDPELQRSYKAGALHRILAGVLGFIDDVEKDEIAGKVNQDAPEMLVVGAGCAKCGAVDIPLIGHEPCRGLINA